MRAFGWLQNRTREPIRVVIPIAVFVVTVKGLFERLDCASGGIE